MPPEGADHLTTLSPLIHIPPYYLDLHPTSVAEQKVPLGIDVLFGFGYVRVNITYRG